MYLVGGGTHPGSGLPVIYSSARITTELLLDDLDLKQRPAPRRRARPAPTAGATPAAV
jgi:phytoene desaturase